MNTARLAVSALAMTASLGAHALSLTIDSRLLEANSSLTYTQDALDLLDTIGLKAYASGYARDIATNELGQVTKHNMPITSLTVEYTFPFTLKVPTAASINGTVLNFERAGKAVSLSDIGVDYKRNIITGTFNSALTGKLTGQELFKFDLSRPLSLAGSLFTGIYADLGMNNLFMTDATGANFLKGLNLSPRLINTVLFTNFGSIDAKVVPWLRKTPLTNLTVTSVPEPSTYALFGVGAALGLYLSKRRRAA
jgi:hypothetical protein